MTRSNGKVHILGKHFHLDSAQTAQDPSRPEAEVPGKVHILSDSETSALAARVEEIEKTHGQQAAVDWQSGPRRSLQVRSSSFRPGSSKGPLKGEGGAEPRQVAMLSSTVSSACIGASTLVLSTVHSTPGLFAFKHILAPGCFVVESCTNIGCVSYQLFCLSLRRSLPFDRTYARSSF